MMRTIFITFLFFGILVFSVESSYACSCAFNYKPLSVSRSEATIAFLGKVKKVKITSNKINDGDRTPNRLVEFEIKKIYKGLSTSAKQISLKTRVGEASCGLDEAPKEGEMWSIFVYKSEKHNLSYFGGLCSPSRKMEDKSDISDFEEKLFNPKENQAIIGTILSEMPGENEIKDLEVTLESESESFKTKTDASGQFYFPLKFAGKFKVIIKTPFKSSVFTSIFETQTDFRDISNETFLTYEIQLKPNDFHYNEIVLLKYAQ